MTSIIPAVVENHLDAIHCTSDGKIILTSSNLTGRYWNGSLWCFGNVEDAPNVEKCLTGIDVSAGVCDLAAISNNLFALGLDSGGLEVYKLDTDPAAQFIWTFGVCEHDDYVSSLSLNSNKTHLVTAGADKCIKIWDTNTWSTTATYIPVHDGIIWQVACSLDDPDVFVSCGQDGKVLIFDLRLPKPASLIDTTLKGGPTSVCWKPGNLSIFAVGDDSGVIEMKDTRNAGSTGSWNAHKRRIHRMAFAKSTPFLASCADDTDVTVTSLEGETPSIIYKSDVHDDFVRGLSWTEENDLVSCGWDKKVLNHTNASILCKSKVVG